MLVITSTFICAPVHRLVSCVASQNVVTLAWILSWNLLSWSLRWELEMVQWLARPRHVVHKEGFPTKRSTENDTVRFFVRDFNRARLAA
eukprot:SAG31_NODE_103_length_25164_cov_12.124317_24_plen_89_part_00